MNPLKGSRNDMRAKETKHVETPGSKPKVRYAITMCTQTISNFKNERRGNGIRNTLDTSRTATTAPKIAVPAKSYTFKLMSASFAS